MDLFLRWFFTCSSVNHRHGPPFKETFFLSFVAKHQRVPNPRNGTWKDRVGDEIWWNVGEKPMINLDRKKEIILRLAPTCYASTKGIIMALVFLKLYVKCWRKLVNKITIEIFWVVPSHEQMRKRLPFSLLNDKQMVATRWGLSTNQKFCMGIFHKHLGCNQNPVQVRHVGAWPIKIFIPGFDPNPLVCRDKPPFVTNCFCQEHWRLVLIIQSYTLGVAKTLVVGGMGIKKKILRGSKEKY